MTNIKSPEEKAQCRFNNSVKEEKSSNLCYFNKKINGDVKYWINNQATSFSVITVINYLNMSNLQSKEEENGEISTFFFPNNSIRTFPHSNCCK